MKQPKLSEVTIDRDETKRIRAMMAKTKRIKITINIDESTLKDLRRLSASTGIPYQTLLNRILQDAIEQKIAEESRLEKIEREIVGILFQKRLFTFSKKAVRSLCHALGSLSTKSMRRTLMIKSLRATLQGS